MNPYHLALNLWKIPWKVTWNRKIPSGSSIGTCSFKIVMLGFREYNVGKTWPIHGACGEWMEWMEDDEVTNLGANLPLSMFMSKLAHRKVSRSRTDFFSSNLPLCGSILVNNGGGSAYPENTLYMKTFFFKSIPAEIPKSFQLPYEIRAS